MDIQQALDTATVAWLTAFGKPLKDIEAEILKGAWYGQTYDEIAELCSYSAQYLRGDIGNKFWKRLSQALGEPVGKTNFRSAIQRYYRNQAQTLSSPSTNSRIYGDATIDTSRFYERTVELNRLFEWVETAHCRLVGVFGMSGIGKTFLTAKFVEQIQGQFEIVIWRSLRQALPLETWLKELILLLSNQQETEFTLTRLLDWLRARRCLLVLDSLETLLEGGQRTGQYRRGYQDYGDLLRAVGESEHGSCLMVISREKPTEIALLEGADAAVRSLHLSGSRGMALSVIAAKGLIGTEAQNHQLCRHYGDNPLALKIVASSIRELFDGDIAAFLAEGVIVFDSIRRWLDAQFDRLSPLEQQIMYELACQDKPTPMADLSASLASVLTKSQLLDTLESLRWRSLIDRQLGGYTQIPVVVAYLRLYHQALARPQDIQAITPQSLKDLEKAWMNSDTFCLIPNRRLLPMLSHQ
jgi:hypothetical protein